MTGSANSAAMIAHRGYSFLYPENTALALTEAAKHGVEDVETDLRMSLTIKFLNCLNFINRCAKM